MSVSGFEKEWWFPWTTGTPCTVGLVAAVAAMLFPVPHFAYRELRGRLAYQAMMERHAARQDLIPSGELIVQRAQMPGA